MKRFRHSLLLMAISALAVPSASADAAICRRVTATSGDSIRLSIRDCGSTNRPVFIFVHGWMSGQWVWDRQVADLSQDFRVITYDLRGHGASGKPKDPDAYRYRLQWAQDLDAVIRARRIRRAILVGWSLGAYPVLDYTSFYGSSHVAGLVLVGAGTQFNTSESARWIGPALLKVLKPEPNVAGISSAAARTFYRSAMVSGSLTADERANLEHSLRTMSSQTRFDALQRADDGFNNSFGFDAFFARTRLPILLLHGVKDPVLTIEAARHVAAINRTIRLIEYPGVGHMPFWEVTKQFDADLREFSQIATRDR